jgi:GNAT superfamily N-acetyltransferase
MMSLFATLRVSRLGYEMLSAAKHDNHSTLRDYQERNVTESLRTEIIARHTLSPAQNEEIIALCTRAYEEDFRSLLAMFDDATHVLAYLDRQLVSHAMWVPRTLTYNGTPLHSAYVEAVATEPLHQGRGYASRVLRAVADAITAFDLGALSPSDPAFYTRLGWEEWRGPLAVERDGVVTPTPDEGVMILRLPNTPPLDLGGALVAPWRAGEIW